MRKYDTGECWRAAEVESVEVWEVSGIETTRYKTIQKYNLMKSKKKIGSIDKIVFLLQLNFDVKNKKSVQWRFLTLNVTIR